MPCQVRGGKPSAAPVQWGGLTLRELFPGTSTPARKRMPFNRRAKGGHGGKQIPADMAEKSAPGPSMVLAEVTYNNGQQCNKQKYEGQMHPRCRGRGGAAPTNNHPG